MKKQNIVQMPGFIKQMFILLVLVLFGFGGSLSTKCVFMNIQPCIVRPTLIDLNPDELYYYPFIISPDRCYGGCNIVEDPFGRMCAVSKIEDKILKVFIMIKGINESKTIVKH